MRSGDLLELFRVEMNDREAPFLWDDDLVYSYIDDAHKQFARKTSGIQDSTTTAVVQLAVTPASDTYSLHPSILKIRAARRADNGKDIEVVNVEDMPTRRWFFDGRADKVVALVTGMDEGSVRTWPYPSETINILLTVFRMPLVDIVDDQVLEIGAQHHRHLLHWVKHLAYLKQDADAFDRTKAKEFSDLFEQYCDNANAEQSRLRHKHRTVAYGGI